MNIGGDWNSAVGTFNEGTGKVIFDGDSIYALLIGGISLIVAAIMVVFVEDVNS